MTDAYVGFGSNIDAALNLRQGLARLKDAYGTIGVSRVYRSPAYGFRGADFLNIVVGFECRLSPEALAVELATIEQAAGRSASKRKGPRTLDLDLLLFGATVDARLRLPRDDVLAYPFVLAPLNDLAPELGHPVTGVSIARAWQAMLATEPALSCIGTADEYLS